MTKSLMACAVIALTFILVGLITALSTKITRSETLRTKSFDLCVAQQGVPEVAADGGVSCVWKS